MSNNTINIDIDAMTEDFKAHCKVIKLGCESPGYTGKEKYGIGLPCQNQEISLLQG